MQAKCTNNSTHGAGYGYIQISEANLGVKHKFSIQRASDRKYLCNLGWQETEEFLAPLSEEIQDDNLILEVGPKVIDRLDQLEIYRFSLQGIGPIQKSALQLESLVYSNLEHSGSVESLAFTEPLENLPKQIKIEPTVSASDSSDSSAAPERLQLVEPVQARNKSWIVILIVVILLLAGLGTWYWYGQQVAVDLAKSALETTELAESKEPELEQKSVEPEQAKPIPTSEKTEPAGQIPVAPTPAPVSPPPAQTSSPAPTPSARSIATDFMLKPGTAKEAWTLGQQLGTAPNFKSDSAAQDTQFLFIEYAAEGGEPEAMLALARIYDPNVDLKQGTIKKDREQAKIWYRKAQQAGIDTTAALKKL